MSTTHKKLSDMSPEQLRERIVEMSMELDRARGVLREAHSFFSAGLAEAVFDDTAEGREIQGEIQTMLTAMIAVIHP